MTREELVVAEAIKMQDAHRMAADLRTGTGDEVNGCITEENPATKRHNEA